MNRSTFLGALAVGLVAASAPGMGAAHQGQDSEEYKSTADTIVLLRDELSTTKGKEVTVMRLELPPGWVGGRHYHTGDVFVYVLEGAFVIDVEGAERKVFRAGEVYHEAVNAEMLARNASTTEPTRLILFQVRKQGEPLMIKAD